MSALEMRHAVATTGHDGEVFSDLLRSFIAEKSLEFSLKYFVKILIK